MFVPSLRRKINTEVNAGDKDGNAFDTVDSATDFFNPKRNSVRSGESKRDERSSNWCDNSVENKSENLEDTVPFSKDNDLPSSVNTSTENANNSSNVLIPTLNGNANSSIKLF